MKKFVALGALIAFLLVPSMLFAQASRVNVHMYSIESVAEDSSESNTWIIAKDDIDTSETINIATYKNIGTIFKFGGYVALGADSLALSIYGDVSWNDTTWVMVDSIAICPITFTECVAVSGTDSSYYKSWTLPAAPYFRLRVKAWDGVTDEEDGVTVDIRVMKQQ